MGKGVDTFRKRVENSPRTGSGVARFSALTAAATVLIQAYLPETIGSLDKATDPSSYATIAAMGATVLTSVVAYIREIALAFKRKVLSW